MNELGFISFVVACMGLPTALGDPIYDPFWEEAQRLDVPICVHGDRRSSDEVGGDARSEPSARCTATLLPPGC